jgi:ribosomal protein L13
VIRHAVKGMLPKNKLQDKMIIRLHAFAGAEHKFGDKFKKEN